MNTRMRIALAAALALAGAAGALLGSPGTPAATTATPTMNVLRGLGAYEVKNVINGVAYFVYADSVNHTRNTLYSLVDRNGTPTPVATLPNEISTVSPLHTGTIIATTDGASKLWRSPDGGHTFTPVLQLTQTPYKDQVLVNHSVADDGTYAYVCTYNQWPSSSNQNPVRIWRSGDDGQTWQIVSTLTTTKHAHACLAEPGGPLVVLTGDNGAAGVYVSTDHGQTLTAKCAGRTDPRCIYVDADLRAGVLTGVTDVPDGGNSLERLDLTTGTLTQLGTRPYEDFDGGFRLPDGSIVFGSTYEARGLHWNDPNLHVDVLTPDARLSTVYSAPIPNTTLMGYLNVMGGYPDGAFWIYRSGYGSMLAQVNTGLPAVPPSSTTTSLPATTTAVTATTPSCP